jgi:copper resistance protein D
VISDGTAWSVLTETHFGRIWEGRFLIAILLFCVGLFGSGLRARGLRLLSLQAGLAIAFVGMLAWSGHAADGIGFPGVLHFAGDALHLLAAAAWVGGLIPLLMFIAPRVAVPNPLSSTALGSSDDFPLLRS